MKRVGILGGMSHEAAARYYTEISSLVAQHSGGVSSAEICLHTIDFADYYDLMQKGEWGRIDARLAYETKILRHDCKCDYIAFSDSVAYKSLITVERLVPTPINVQSPIVHIGDCIAENCLTQNFRRVAMLGTRPIMTEDFLAVRLNQHGILVDNASSSFLMDNQIIKELERIIFGELRCGILSEESRCFLKNLVYILIHQEHFDAVVLGCAELGAAFHRMCIRSRCLIDATEVHIRKLAELALL